MKKLFYLSLFVCVLLTYNICQASDTLEKFKGLSKKEKLSFFEKVISTTEKFVGKSPQLIRSFADCFAETYSSVGDINGTKKTTNCDISKTFSDVYQSLEDTFKQENPTKSREINKKNLLEPSEFIQLSNKYDNDDIDFRTKLTPSTAQRTNRTNYEAFAFLAWGIIWEYESGMDISKFIWGLKKKQDSEQYKDEIFEKWSIIRDAFPSFEKWRSVWGKKNNGMEIIEKDEKGGINSICRDWLILEPISAPPPPPPAKQKWELKFDEPRWTNIFKIKNFADIPKRLISAERSASTKGCTIYSSKESCVKEIMKLKQRKEDSGKKEEGSLDAAETVQEYGFYLKMMKETIEKYFTTLGPKDRIIKYLKEKKDDANVNSYVLPNDDLKMCWNVMDTALRTRPKSRGEPLSQWKVITHLTLYSVLFFAALRIGVLYLSVGARKFTEYPCRELTPNDSLIKSIDCTNGNSFGSTCFVTCTKNSGSQLDGMGRKLFFTCLGENGWSESDPELLCSPQLNYSPKQIIQI
eukprot:c20947_g1_i1.p1 GENE.c20947_g1_i1~~c20947_g1_i1.p1  ORF type:complete len:523 (-),score=133.65 c20947_g1_i1:29-1597(-)